MAGYTPVFDSVYAGTLCGRWPTTAVWVTLLPLCDKHGHIDLSYSAICALTGWPLELLQQGIAELMKPDPDSRSSAEEGRRLVLIDPGNRSWGWRVVNHGLYREKARKQAFDAARGADGRNAQRMADRRRTREDPRSPAETHLDPPSNANANTDSNKNSEVLSDSSPDLYVSSSSPALKREERFKKSSEEGRTRVQALTRSLAQSKRLPK